MQYSIVQYTTVYNAVKYSTVYNAIQYSAVLYSIQCSKLHRRLVLFYIFSLRLKFTQMFKPERGIQEFPLKIYSQFPALSTA